MTRPIPTQADNPGGLHRHYNITKADGSPMDPDATYFVLRIDPNGNDLEHVLACRQAARRYAETILANNEAQHLWQMAKELHCLLS